jgi:hypothetical protein
MNRSRFGIWPAGSSYFVRNWAIALSKAGQPGFCRKSDRKKCHPSETSEDVASSPSPTEIKKPSKDQGLFNGAGEEGRTPDLMLGKHTL